MARRSDEHRINEEIRADEVRVVDPDGEQVGVLERNQAIYLAKELGLDLVEVAPAARPPVTRLMDYGRYKYEQSVRAREERRKGRSQRMGLKEITFRPHISDHDLDRKRRRAESFLADGDKVKVTVRLRGRERSKPELAMDVLAQMMTAMESEPVLESEPAHTGRTVTMTLVPGR